MRASDDRSKSASVANCFLVNEEARARHACRPALDRRVRPPHTPTRRRYATHLAFKAKCDADHLTGALTWPGGATLDGMATTLERVMQAWNSHDADRVASLFAEDYVSDQPLHPSRGFRGRHQVLANWTSVFDGVPDFCAELVGSSVDGHTEWGEWNWVGHHPDSSSFAMRGVTILLVRDDLIARGRLFMEPVDAARDDIDAAVRELYKSPGSSSS